MMLTLMLVHEADPMALATRGHEGGCLFPPTIDTRISVPPCLVW